jgi:hypothetical protein
LPLTKKKIVVDMRFITTFDIMPPFKFRPQCQIKSDYDSMDVRLNLGQYK